MCPPCRWVPGMSSAATPAMSALSAAWYRQATPASVSWAVRHACPANAAGAAAEAGIQSGDVILSFNGKPVKSVEDLRALVAKAGKKVALLVLRDDAKIFVPVDLG